MSAPPPPYDITQQGYPPAQSYPPAQPYPPAQAPPPAQTTTSNTVIVQQPAANVVQGTVFPDHSISYNCHICHTQQMTRVHHHIGLLPWLVVGILCLILLPFGLCPFALIPLCIPALMDVYHICPNCNNQVGVCKRLS